MDQSPLIFDIRHFVLDDGPGIRTTVFMKGCPLSCAWCHNPEGISPKKELVFYSDRCIHCETCVSVCPKQAIDMKSAYRVNHLECDCCGLCARECPSKAIQVIGRYYSPDELVDVLLTDQLFYQTSSGGVTFSGGEPTMFMDYLSAVVKKLKQHDIHISIQTSGVFDFQLFKDKLLPYLDLIYIDLKLMDKTKYKTWVGGDAEIPLENFEKLCKHPGVRVIASIPLVPGITSTINNLAGIKNFLVKTGCREYVFRPYHPGGIAKSFTLGKNAPDSIPEKHLSINEEKKATEYFMEIK
jgi:pyruvate formate lyase activating enzyme